MDEFAAGYILIFLALLQTIGAQTTRNYESYDENAKIIVDWIAPYWALLEFSVRLRRSVHPIPVHLQMRYLPRFVFTMKGKYAPQKVCSLPDDRLFMAQAYRDATNCNYDVKISIGDMEVFVDGFFETEEIRQTAVFYLGASGFLNGGYRIWRQSGNQIRIDKQPDDYIKEILFLPRENCSEETPKGVVQISLTQFVMKDEAWIDLEQSQDKGAPLFVNFDEYLAKKDESVKALYIGDSFLPKDYAGQTFPSVLLIAAIIVINGFLHFH